MTTIYQLKHTDGVRTLTIQPGTVNGDGGSAEDTDLSLYGQGSLAWGKGVDQNQLRLLENFACPESILFPGNPMNEAEIGSAGAGINNPIIGQTWFNTSTNTQYYYTGVVWKTDNAAGAFLPLSGGTLTGALTITNANLTVSGGTLQVWAQADNNDGRIEFGNGGAVSLSYDNVTGFALSGGNLSMFTNRITSLGNPRTDLDATNKRYVDERYTVAFGSAMPAPIKVFNNEINGSRLHMAWTGGNMRIQGDGLASLEAFSAGPVTLPRIVLDTSQGDSQVHISAPHPDVSSGYSRYVVEFTMGLNAAPSTQQAYSAGLMSLADGTNALTWSAAVVITDSASPTNFTLYVNNVMVHDTGLSVAGSPNGRRSWKIEEAIDVAETRFYTRDFSNQPWTLIYTHPAAIGSTQFCVNARQVIGIGGPADVFSFGSIKVSAFNV